MTIGRRTPRSRPALKLRIKPPTSWNMPALADHLASWPCGGPHSLWNPTRERSRVDDQWQASREAYSYTTGVAAATCSVAATLGMEG